MHRSDPRSDVWQPDARAYARPPRPDAVALETTLTDKDPSKAPKPQKAARSALPQRGRAGTWLRRLLALSLLAGAAAVTSAWVGFAALEARLPDVFSLQSYRQIALESSRVYAAGGEALARFGTENRTVVGIDQIPDTLRYAVVAAEDAAFYHHPGLDLLGIARALWIDVVAGRYKQGASTITQQFAKTRFLSAEKSVVRKLSELVLARKIEQKASKDEILAMYLNEIYYGHGAYGCEEAARLFFGKPVGQIDLAEAAMLAGVVNAPSRWSPINHPERAKQRRAYVLDQMHKRGYIGAEDAARAAEAPLPTTLHDDLGAHAPWVVSAVRRELDAMAKAGTVPPGALEAGGLRIEVGIDVVAQQAAEAAVASGLLAIDRKIGSAEPLRRYASDAEIAEGLATIRKTLGAGPPPLGKVLLGIVVGRRDKGFAVDLSLDPADGQGLLPDAHLGRYAAAADKPADALFRRGDLLRVSILERTAKGPLLVPELGPQAAVVAIEPQTRLIRALVGGDDARLHPFHRATDALRQPGSTFKTFVYGAAIESGAFTAESELVDEKRAFRSDGRLWTPRNYTGKWDGKRHSLRDALARSINSIAVAVAEAVGPDTIAAFAGRMGVASPLRADLPLALGASSVRPLELTNAYATIAADGVRAPALLVTRIVDRDGKPLFVAQHRPERAISVEVARALADMLGEVVRRGSARSAKVGHPIAGKTGTTNGGRDAWFVGFSARLCASVWVGYDDRKPVKDGSGATFALPIWADFMRAALDRVAVLPLPRLPHVMDAGMEPIPLDEDPEAGAATLDEPPASGPAQQAPAPAIVDDALEPIAR